MRFVLPLSLLLAGCTGRTPEEQSKRNDWIINETKKCEAAGLEAHSLVTEGGVVEVVQCTPKEIKK